LKRNTLAAVVPAAIAVSVGLPMAAQAGQPAFGCARTQSAVEQLICSDTSLAVLDRRLDEIYKAALAKAKGPLARRLREDQRGWVKGRNECWKADGLETWITASWSVSTVRACVDARYRLRSAELQAVWRLLPPRTVAYACQNDPANEVVANFFATEPATLRLERGDQTRTLWRVGVAPAGTYEGQNVSVVHRERQMELSWLDTDAGKTHKLHCRAK
jgi:uncharacterized protein